MKERSKARSSSWRAIVGVFAVTLASLFAITGAGGMATAASAQTTSAYTPAPTGELDCNGFSPVQKEVRANLCTDIRGFAGYNNSNTWGGKFYDNGHYIGHDEPDTTFL